MFYLFSFLYFAFSVDRFKLIHIWRIPCVRLVEFNKRHTSAGTWYAFGTSVAHAGNGSMLWKECEVTNL